MEQHCRNAIYKCAYEDKLYNAKAAYKLYKVDRILVGLSYCLMWNFYIRIKFIIRLWYLPSLYILSHHICGNSWGMRLFEMLLHNLELEMA